MAFSLPFCNNGPCMIQLNIVTSPTNNDVMKTLGLLIISCVLSASSSLAIADVLIDLAQDDEISILNTQIEHRYTLKITEPVENHSQQDGIIQTTTTSTNQIKLLPYHAEVLAAANITALQPALIHALITVESKHNAQAISNKGAYGLMQLMPATAKRFRVKDRRDAGQNILAGAQYLRELLTLYNGDLSLTLAAYNAGPGAVQKYRNRIPPYRETMRYVPTVLKYYRQYS